jgi:hypothetical protein
VPLTAKRSCLSILLPPFLLAALPVHSQNPSAALGKQHAASSRLEWEIRESAHPSLGNIRFAFLKNPVETAIGSSRIYSRAYLSCQKGAKKFAIELTNTSSPDDKGGLKPATMPRLVCNRPENDKLVKEELLTNWEVSPIGDALVRGFRAFPLRECVSIDVVQDVALPAGWAKKSATVEFEITPYTRELDSIFVACGDISAYAPDAGPVPAIASAPARPTAPPAPPPKLATVSSPTTPKLGMAMPPAPAAAPPKVVNAPPPVASPSQTPSAKASAQESASPWQGARTTANGKTNVRAEPNLQSALVTTLYPGSVILVQKTGSEWWRVKTSGAAAPTGYIRQDRLVFK